MRILPDLSSRQIVGELMDDPSLPEDEHLRALRGLKWINRFSGVIRSFWKQLQPRVRVGDRLLDIATGGGDIAIGLAACARRQKVDLDVHGCDISPTAIDIATKNAAAKGVSVTFHTMDVVTQPLPEAYDILTCGLFLHHLHDDQIVRLLCSMQESKARLILISDLERSTSGYLGAWWGTRILSRSHIVHVDGPLSVRAALTPQEIHRMAEQSGLTAPTIQPAWPARWMLRWERP